MNRRILIIGAGVVVILFLVMTSSRSKKASTVKAGTPQAGKSAQTLYSDALAFKGQGKKVEAKLVYQKILMEHPDFEKVEELQKDLEMLNMDILFSKTQTPSTVVHEVKSGDSISKIAKKYGTTIEFIKKSNNLKNDIIRVGDQLRIWTGKFNLYVDKSQNILILKDADEVLRIYDVSTGENNSTPVGDFTIINKLVDPVWFNRGAVVPPESPRNVLGSRWLGFDLPGYGIHGTIDPNNIGQQVTAGCIRMRNEDVEELYSLIPRGTQVVVVD